MTRLDDRYPDLLEETRDAGRRQLIQDLDTEYRVSPSLPVRIAIARTLDEHVRGQARALSPRRVPVFTTILLRWASAIAAVMLVLGGLLGYFRLQTPATVSAAAIVQRASTARPAAGPDQALHETGTLYLNGSFDLPDQLLFTPPMTLALDQWTQLDQGGAISRQLTALSAANGALVARGLQVGAGEQIYGALQNAITTEPAPSSRDYLWLANPLGVSDIPALLSAAQSSTTGSLRLLPQQAINGVLLDVVQIRTAPNPGNDGFPHPVGSAGSAAQLTTMYVDPQTYAIRGVDVTTEQVSGTQTLTFSLRVSPLAIVPIASVPADTFTLDAPAGARFLPPRQPQHEQPHPAAPAATLLLAQTPTGLQLGQLNRSIGNPFATTSISYCGGDGHCAQQPPNATQFEISFAQTQPPSAHVPPMLATGQLRTLTIAGRPVQAYYLDEGTPTGSRRLIYQQDDVTIELYGEGLSSTAFFDAVGALVDVRTHTILIPEKWRQDSSFSALG